MFRIITSLIFILFTINLFSFTEHDKKVAQALIDYSREITLEFINEVLEFDPNNQYIIKEKIKLLYNENGSFTDIIALMNKVDEFDYQIWFIDLEMNYRLGNYKWISSNLEKYKDLTDERSIFYKSDSFIRIGTYSIAKDINDEGLFRNPYSIILNELNYILTKDSGSLRIIRSEKSGLDSLLRVFNRVDIDDRSYNIIKNLLKNDLKEIELANSVIMNYNALPFVQSHINDDLTGIFYFDKDSNTFVDTEFEVKNGELLKKSIDLTGDGKFDNQIELFDSKPTKIVYYNTELIYSSYPYVYKVFNYKSYKTILHFFNNKTVYRIGKLLEDNTVPVLQYESNSYVKTKEKIYIGSYEKWEFKTPNTIIKYIDEENKGIYSHVLMVVDNNNVSGIRDLDYDGVYDVHEKYLGGRLIGSGLLVNGKYEYYESYNEFDVKLFNSNDDSIKFLIEDKNGNIYKIDLNKTRELESVVDINKGNYNWILEK